MKHKELVKELKKRMSRYGYCETWTHIEMFIKEYKALTEDEKVKVPRFVADWIEYCKNTFLSLVRALMVDEVDFYNYANQEDHSRLINFLGSEINQRIFARAWLDGYEVEKEKRFRVRVKGIAEAFNILNYNTVQKMYSISTSVESGVYITKFTRKELEEANLDWVFDCPGIEVEEVGE